MINYSAEQKALFNWAAIGSGHSICESVAGSGKTETIVTAINKAFSPEILYCVFGKKQQLEAEKRITNKNCQVSTLHSLGYKIILQHWRGVRASGFTEYSRAKGLAPDAPAQIHFKVSELVKYLKNTFVTVPNITEIKQIALIKDIDSSKKDSAAGWTQDKICDIALNSIKLSLDYPKDKLISFEDMVWQCSVQGWTRPTYSLLFCDEFQDVSLPQYTMLKALCKPNGRMCLVGDPAQSIFAFRGTIGDSMSKAQIELSAKKFMLSVSYRCPKVITELAREIVPSIQSAENAIQGEIMDCNYETALKLIKINDVILSRTNFPLVKVCLNLIKKGTPAYCLGKDIGQMLIKTIDDLEAGNINDFYEKLESWLAYKRAKLTGYNAGRAIETAVDTAEAIRAIAESCLTVEAVKTKINSLFFDSNDVKVPSAICSTSHKFKGLQARNIFMMMETFSAGRRVLTPEEISQEKNLKYVSITRSQEKLIRII